MKVSYESETFRICNNKRRKTQTSSFFVNNMK